MNWLRRLYDWVLSWASSPYAVPVLFTVSFVESSFFPIPADPLLIALILGLRQRAFYYAFICTAGSVFGGIFGYFVGSFLWWTETMEFSSIATFFFTYIPGFTEQLFYNIQAQYESYNFIVIFTAAFTPIPYKVFSISAGAFDINFFTFVVASILGRGLRFYGITVVLWYFGRPVKKIIDKYFDLLAILLLLISIISYIIIVYIF
ncbi:MAG: YqaA family protein [Candidatus Neomarinimicrobiota bacterium]|nr:YqaA family protein [Candidatus Neomarinimicrobiota bacterium]